MSIWTKISKKVSAFCRCIKGDSAHAVELGERYLTLSGFEIELIEQAMELEEKHHELETKKEMDKVQITFSRILMAAAILTLGLILLSSFEIPYVSVSQEFVKLMINSVIVEVAGIVVLVLTKHIGKEDKKDH
jgi:H+/gluconate symporter-like permease